MPLGAPDLLMTPSSTSLLHLPQSVFKIAQFRTHQREVIHATMQGRDCLVLMPSGGGKSLCYQLPSLLSEAGLTLVVR